MVYLYGEKSTKIIISIDNIILKVHDLYSSLDVRYLIRKVMISFVMFEKNIIIQN